MPYITADRREAVTTDAETPRDAGELNYVLTMVVLDYVQEHGLRYAVINDVLGALDGAGREFYRRVAAPYEDKKRFENGDAYPGQLTFG